MPEPNKIKGQVARHPLQVTSQLHCSNSLPLQDLPLKIVELEHADHDQISVAIVSLPYVLLDYWTSLTGFGWSRSNFMRISLLIKSEFGVTPVVAWGELWYISIKSHVCDKPLFLLAFSDCFIAYLDLCLLLSRKDRCTREDWPQWEVPIVAVPKKDGAVIKGNCKPCRGRVDPVALPRVFWEDLRTCWSN